MATTMIEYAQTTAPSGGTVASKSFNLGWLAALAAGAYFLMREKDPLDPGSFEGLTRRRRRRRRRR